MKVQNTWEINFVILGNQENPEGNPIPYHRTTQGSYWNKGSRRYNAWKQFVVAQFLKQNPENSGMGRYGAMYLKFGKPLKLSGDSKAEEFKKTRYIAKVYLDIKWANGNHADGDNIFKGIADALFYNDKDITLGHFESSDSPDKKGSVIGKIVVEQIKR